MKTTIEDQQINALTLTDSVYCFADCELKNCDFSRHNLNNFEFSDCTFIQCDLSMATLENTAFNRVTFKDCKLLGLNFSKTSKFLFSVSFSTCFLDYCMFHKINFKKTLFDGCTIKEATFEECNLENAIFRDCNLQLSQFDRCNLKKADFSTARDYFLDLDNNRVAKAKFAYPDVLNLLSKYDINIV